MPSIVAWKCLTLPGSAWVSLTPTTPGSPRTQHLAWINQLSTNLLLCLHKERISIRDVPCEQYLVVLLLCPSNHRNTGCKPNICWPQQTWTTSLDSTWLWSPTMHEWTILKWPRQSMIPQQPRTLTWTYCETNSLSTIFVGLGWIFLTLWASRKGGPCRELCLNFVPLCSSIKPKCSSMKNFWKQDIRKPPKGLEVSFWLGGGSHLQALLANCKVLWTWGGYARKDAQPYSVNNRKVDTLHFSRRISLAESLGKHPCRECWFKIMSISAQFLVAFQLQHIASNAVSQNFPLMRLLKVGGFGPMFRNFFFCVCLVVQNCLFRGHVFEQTKYCRQFWGIASQAFASLAMQFKPLTKVRSTKSNQRLRGRAWPWEGEGPWLQYVWETLRVVWSGSTTKQEARDPERKARFDLSSSSEVDLCLSKQRCNQTSLSLRFAEPCPTEGQHMSSSSQESWGTTETEHVNLFTKFLFTFWMPLTLPLMMDFVLRLQALSQNCEQALPNFQTIRDLNRLAFLRDAKRQGARQQTTARSVSA